MNNKRKTYRAKEISKIYGIGLSTVWKYVKDERLTPIKVSSRITLFDVNEVDSLFLKNNKS